MLNPQAYIGSVIKLFEEYSLYSGQDRFNKIVENLRTSTSGAKSVMETHTYINNAVKELHPHGALITTRQQREFLKPTQGKRLESFDVIAYLNIPGISTGSQDKKKDWVNAAHQLISALDGENLAGWVIDLRWNKGGNLEPIISALGPFWEEETPLGYFKFGDTKETWRYCAGTLCFPSWRTPTMAEEPYMLINKNVPKIILTGGQTESSGEAAVLSFMGADNTYILGRPTRGFTAANLTFRLDDGACLHLSAGVMGNRDGREYEGAIMPQELFPQSENKEEQTLKNVDCDSLVLHAARQIQQRRCYPTINIC